jgi:O-antigen chain-terminating methyltransferase
MIVRFRRLASRVRQSPGRIDQVERHLQQVSAHLAAIDSRAALHQMLLQEVPDYFLAAESAIVGRLQAAASEAEAAAMGAAAVHADAAVAAAMRASREHVDAAVAAAMHVVGEASREHVDAAVAAAMRVVGEASREHVDAAVAAAMVVLAENSRQHVESSSQASIEASRAHAELLGRQVRDHVDAELARLRRELLTLKRARAAKSVNPDGLPPSTVASAALELNADVDPAFYVALEDRFRGDSDVIAVRQKAYLSVVSGSCDADHPVLDLGFGRGEWLTVLRDFGVAATGVDMNPAFVAEATDLGHSVVLGDLVEYLHAAADGSAGAITMFQVVEHLPLPVLLDVLAESVRVLRPGGVFIAETPNALNLRVAASTFWIDPTHQRPLHPEFLRFCAEQAGFASAEGLFLNDLQPGYESVSDPVVRRLLEMIDGPGDYSLIART